ncbi:Uncharacterised protein [[Flavobacterium] thermophilum]|nr:Uncharacterised protein [[Flavobacterium] thermophilum]
MIVLDQKVKVKWHGSNKKHYESLGYKFTKIGDEFEVDIKHLSLGSNALVKCYCDYCNELFNRKYCQVNECKFHFCSQKCQALWQSQFRVGEKSSNYKKDIPIEDRTITCQWCRRKFTVMPSEINKTKFCSKKCRQEWYAKVWSQNPEWREKSKRRAVKILSEGKIEKVNTECQIIVNNLLDELNIKYINEYNCEYVTIDNYLPDYNLMIEVMGTYWHVDPRFYEKIYYQMQFDRIIHDKRKNSIIKSLYNIDILYLWEHDILSNKELCKELIKMYINKKGELDEYNSFNYEILDGCLILTNKYKPFIVYDIEELHNLFELKSGEKKSLKQEDKWIKFNCDCCGKETEQLKSRYNKAKHHFCSQKCKKIFQQKGNNKTLGVEVKCDYCGKPKIVTNYQYNDYLAGKKKNFFCNYECFNKWKKVNFKGENNPNYKGRK